MSAPDLEPEPEPPASPDAAGERAGAPSLELRRLQTEAFLNFGRLHRALDSCVGTLFAREGLEGITPAQSALLMVLFQARRPLTARELAEHQGLSQPTIGRFVRALETEGWVSREVDPQDARAILIRPTRKARRALPRFIAVSNAMLDRAFEGFGEVAVRRVASTTRRLRENLERAEREAAGDRDER
ncbi:MAG: MarR family transcriptional regulator [Myxococcales bacterium]|nr:MarR family transcriptional regulator [Myxococcales bacterium]MCB9713234.1 MarR family transcriptional regulator [Myxococcales bacterium]